MPEGKDRLPLPTALPLDEGHFRGVSPLLVISSTSLAKLPGSKEQKTRGEKDPREGKKKLLQSPLDWRQ